MIPINTDQQRPVPEIIAVASQKGGVGKTTTAVNLAVALVAAGRRVLLMDLDPQGHAGHTLVRGGQGQSGIDQVLREATLTRDTVAATEIPDLFLTPSTPGLGGSESELALMGDSRTRLHQALATLPALPFQFDHVVIDCPPTMGLLTLNALTAAHRILLPLSCESFVLESLPTALKTINRLRAGLTQPLLGVHALVSMRTPDPTAHTLIAALRQDYGRMTLLTEIPFDPQVREAAARGRPLLAHCLPCEVSQSYLTLAAEWLTLDEQSGPTDGHWHLHARQDRMTQLREEMQKRITAWLIDPSSLLYDPREALHHQDAQVLEELFELTRMSRPGARRRRSRRLALAAVLVLLLAVPAALLTRGWPPNLPALDLPAFDLRSLAQEWRVELGAFLIGNERFWQAGSALLARADAAAYRELLLAARIIDENREQLLLCGEQAREQGQTAPCTIGIPAP